MNFVVAAWLIFSIKTQYKQTILTPCVSRKLTSWCSCWLIPLLFLLSFSFPNLLSLIWQRVVCLRPFILNELALSLNFLLKLWLETAFSGASNMLLMEFLRLERLPTLFLIWDLFLGLRLKFWFWEAPRIWDRTMSSGMISLFFSFEGFGNAGWESLFLILYEEIWVVGY